MVMVPNLSIQIPLKFSHLINITFFELYKIYLHSNVY